MCPAQEIYSLQILPLRAAKRLCIKIGKTLTFPICSDTVHHSSHKESFPEGLIMCAKTYEAFYDLQVQLHAGLFCRDYIVLSHGWLPQSLTHIQAHLISSSSGPSLSGGRGKYSCTKLLSVAHIARANWATSFSQLLIRIVSWRI